jgi:hypothetical protein
MAVFPYIGVEGIPASFMPRLPLTLHYGSRSLNAVGLVDSGSTVSVIPFEMGLSLGLVWAEQTTEIDLAGSLGNYEARGLVAFISHPELTKGEQVRQVFAWTTAPHATLILGQMSFFLTFDVHFYRSQLTFEITPKS